MNAKNTYHKATFCSFVYNFALFYFVKGACRVFYLTTIKILSYANRL